MWYLLTLFCLCLLLPLFSTEHPRTAVGILLALTALSLFIGTDRLADYFGSLSRTVVFMPCFFLGHYAGGCFAPGFSEGLQGRRMILHNRNTKTSKNAKKQPDFLRNGLFLVRRKGLEPPTYWFVASHSIQLSYRRIPRFSQAL